ncbi:hypothetical protein [Helicobacter winghamensis]|uniref:Lipoprotein n=1 Tax=Helicobacter winghamensis TaxID=157268 RepID=A0A2N3PL41_9HELI|nr:hypothetical protein [Helicobacter winghamensis]PKT79335.1 hypothetical protein BCM32_06140 [Helicobacter winghamensis]PKT82426.1 hypothetical protein BCM31_04250 [Helicobacter winghamensis]PKT82569.1 hypothetical protein BCM33_06915 [Helicobacter winghamensis]
MQRSVTLSIILTFFLLIFAPFILTGCSKPLANNNFPYPKIAYISAKDSNIIPSNFAETFINRFKILFEKMPNPNLKELRFYFSDYANDATEDFRIPSFNFTPSYHLRLNAQAVYHTHTQNFTQSYSIPIATFNPPYTQDFDGILYKILEQ